jgi:calcium-dependent protein kinase
VFKEADWTGISREAKDLIGKMMNYNYLERFSAKEALEHPWLQQNTVAPNLNLQE